jgi:hypothetical protein
MNNQVIIVSINVLRAFFIGSPFLLSSYRFFSSDSSLFFIVPVITYLIGKSNIFLTLAKREAFGAPLLAVLLLY